MKIPLSDFRDTQIRNLMSNGDMRFWQRGGYGANPFNNPSDGAYLSDRFRVVKSGAMSVAVQRSTQIPTFEESGYQFTYSMQIDVTTGTSGAGDYWGITQFIEGDEIAKHYIWGRPLYYSFWAKGAAAAGKLAVKFSNSNLVSFMKSVDIIGDNVWRKYTIAVPRVPDYQAGVGWNILPGTRGLWVQHILFAGTTHQVTENADWVTSGANLYPTGGNSLLDNGQSLFLTGCQLSFSPDLPFGLKHFDFGGELAHCQRYFEKTYALDTSLQTVTSTGRVTLVKSEGINEFYCVPTFAVTKMVVPNMIGYNPSTGAVGTNSNGEAIAFEGTSEHHVNLRTNSASGSPTRYAHWSADAEL